MDIHGYLRGRRCVVDGGKSTFVKAAFVAALLATSHLEVMEVFLYH